MAVNYVNLFGQQAPQAPQAPQMPMMPVPRVPLQAPMTPAAGAVQGLSSAAQSIIAALAGNRSERANSAVIDALMKSQKGWQAPDDIYQGQMRSPDQIAADPQVQAMLGQPQQVTADPQQMAGMAQGQPGVPQSAPIQPVQVQPLQGGSGQDSLIPSPNDMREDPQGAMSRFNRGVFEGRDIGSPGMNPLAQRESGSAVMDALAGGSSAMSGPPPRARTSMLSVPSQAPQRGDMVAARGETAPGTTGVPAALESLRYTAQENPELARYLQQPMQNMQILELQRQEDARVREQELQDAWLKPTGDEREAYRRGYRPGEPGWDAALEGAKPQTNVTVNANTNPFFEARNENFNKDLGKIQADLVRDVYAGADEARTKKADIQLMRGYNDTAEAGTFAQMNLGKKKALRSAAEVFGLSLDDLGITDNTSQTEAFAALAGAMALDARRPGSGDMSENELMFMSQTVPQLTQTREGRALIMDWLAAREQRRIDKARELRKFYDPNAGTFDMFGFEDSWNGYVERNPLFTPEQMERATTIVSAQPAQPAQAAPTADDPAAIQRRRGQTRFPDPPPAAFQDSGAARQYIENTLTPEQAQEFARRFPDRAKQLLDLIDAENAGAMRGGPSTSMPVR